MKKIVFPLFLLIFGCVQKQKEQNKSSISSINPKIYQRAAIPFRDDLPDRILSRMKQPYITAGEDVELLDQEFDSLLNSVSDRELFNLFELMDAEKLAAIYQFVDPKKMRSYTKAMRLIEARCANYPLFPAKLADNLDALNN